MSEDGRRIRLLSGGLRATRPSEGDITLNWGIKGYPLLQEIKGEGIYDGEERAFGVWVDLIGYYRRKSVQLTRKEEARKKMRRERGYDDWLALTSEAWSAKLGLSSNFRCYQVILWLMVYKYTIWDAFNSHKHPITSLSLLTTSVYVCSIFFVHFLGWCRVIFLFLVSCFVIQMEKDMAISSSSNHSGINTQGKKHFEKSKLVDDVVPTELDSDLIGNQTSQLDSLDVQLEKIKLESLELKKTNSIMGYMCGNTNEFRKIKVKLLGMWRLTRGEVEIYERGHGWFECIFRNEFILKRVWNGRPYHVLGHLLLIRPWRMDFSTKFENTNVLDLWVRIFHLPPTLACHNGVKLILEENRLGKFIKFDRASGGSFARASINIDIAKHVPGEVRISDNEDHPLLLVWFEDFPHGCGNCGDLGHDYKHCPLRMFNPQKISITIIKKDSTSSVIPAVPEVVAEEEEDGWIMVNNVKKKKNTIATNSMTSKVVPVQSGVVYGGATEKGKGTVVIVDHAEKEVATGEVFSSPKASFKDDNKEEGEVDDEMETLMENSEMIGAINELQSEERFIAELEHDLGGPYAAEILQIMPPPFISEGHIKSKSESFKRKGGEEANDDTASSSMKRKKSKGGK